ncbi:hypothetical protein HU200_052737 [Digitaria exilis]|uniref:Uncharacterized protein n=1 Tax=Digitaria exilis TaxID=1010633 RepID=A0A835E5K6_9POAL|nr:hypothetical protein HU200_052737 [Digitaria exilis]
MHDAHRRRHGGGDIDAPLSREREHGGVVEEVLEPSDGLDDGPELVGAREPAGSGGPDGVDVEGDAPLAELEPRHLRRAGRRADEAAADVAERDDARPRGVRGGLHGGGLEDEHGRLGVLGAEPQRQGVPRVVRQDGEVGRDVRRRRRRERQRVAGDSAGAGAGGGGGAEEVGELERGGAADGEGAGDELRAEAEALDVGARREEGVEGSRRSGGAGLGLGLLGRRRRVVVVLGLGFGFALGRLGLRHCRRWMARSYFLGGDWLVDMAALQIERYREMMKKRWGWGGNRGAGRRWGWSEQLREHKISLHIYFFHFLLQFSTSMLLFLIIFVLSLSPAFQGITIECCRETKIKKGRWRFQQQDRHHLSFFLSPLISEESEPVSVGTCPTMVGSEISMTS